MVSEIDCYCQNYSIILLFWHKKLYKETSELRCGEYTEQFIVTL